MGGCAIGDEETMYLFIIFIDEVLTIEQKQLTRGDSNRHLHRVWEATEVGIITKKHCHGKRSRRGIFTMKNHRGGRRPRREMHAMS